VSAPDTDLALLRAHEPVLRYTHGELFFPTAVEGYLAGCDLLEGPSQRELSVVLPVGEVTTERLGSVVASPGTSLFLRFVQEPLSGMELARWQTRPGRDVLRAPARLARVGLFGRLADAAFDVTLLLRGTVPGGTAAAAAGKYAVIRERDPRAVYYGRVVRRNGWIVLHYLWFYCMNDYRSTFHGANDHEADWEQAFIYLDDAPDGPRPVWIAAAAHDYVGDQLRRRWDDPYLEKVGDHPVLHAGAGSHAAYFERGEYLTSVPFSAFRRFGDLLRAGRRFWVTTLGQPDPGDLAARVEAALSVSFVDYARGDGRVIGPGSDTAWSPVVLTGEEPWVAGYRGLFGLDTWDRFGGERSPAGPRYGRDGSQRMAWHDPLGFAGLDKAAPPSRAAGLVDAQIADLRAEQAAVGAEIEAHIARLPGLELEVRAIAQDAGLAGQHRIRAEELKAGERALRELRARTAAIDDRIVGLVRERDRIAAGDLGDPRAHLTHPHRPVPPAFTRYGLIVELWSAMSVAVLLLLVAGMTVVGAAPWWVALGIAIAGYVVLESAIRRRLLRLGLTLVLVLAVLGAFVISWDLRGELILAGVLGLGLFILVENVREVLRR